MPLRPNVYQDALDSYQASLELEERLKGDPGYGVRILLDPTRCYLRMKPQGPTNAEVVARDDPRGGEVILYSSELARFRPSKDSPPLVFTVLKHQPDLAPRMPSAPEDIWYIEHRGEIALHRAVEVNGRAVSAVLENPRAPFAARADGWTTLHAIAQRETRVGAHVLDRLDLDGSQIKDHLGVSVQDVLDGTAPGDIRRSFKNTLRRLLGASR